MGVLARRFGGLLKWNYLDFLCLELQLLLALRAHAIMALNYLCWCLKLKAVV
jgi:hypothetical protein